MHATSRLVAAALIRRGGQVLLVRQQGPEDPAARWTLPAGVVEDGELVFDAVVREVREETGLEVTGAGRLVTVAQYQLPPGRWGGVWTAFTFEVDVRGEIACADPDGQVTDAAWTPVPEAVTRLSEVEFPPMREPGIGRLLRPDSVPLLWTWPDGVLSKPITIPVGAADGAPAEIT